MKRSMVSLLALLLTAPLPVRALSQATDEAPTVDRGMVAQSQAIVNVNDFGAVADKATDNCTAFTNALSAAGAAWKNVLIPASGGEYMTSCTLVLPQGVSLIIDGILGALSGSSASSALVATGEGSGYNWLLRSISGTGALDGKGISANVLWLKQYSQVSVYNIQIYGIPANGVGVRLGDSTTHTLGIGAELHNVSFGDAGITPAASGSTCLFVDTSTDTQYIHGVLNGCAIGVNDTQGNSHYTDLHAWDTKMTTCYLDAGSRTVWTADQCDTASTYGWHLKGTNTQIIGGSYINSIVYGTDNHVIAIQSDLADPQWTIEGFLFQGGDERHRVGADTNVHLADLHSGDIWIGAVYGHTVTRNMGSGLVTTGTTLPNLRSKSGLRYLCIDNRGTVISSVEPCHGS